VIDAHVHLWDLARRPLPWTDPFPVLHRSYGPAELRPLLAAGGVDGVVAVHTVADPDETVELLALEDPEILGVVGWVDLTGDVPGQLARLGGRLVGVRHQLQEEPDRGWLSRADVRSGLSAVARAGLAYDVVVSPEQLPLVVDTVRAQPDLRFVLDHAGKPPLAGGDLTEWAAALTRLAGCPNVAVKLSGLVTEADWTRWTVADLRPAVEHVLAAFGPERVLAGSDWPVCLLAGSYAEVAAATAELIAGLSADERAAVTGGTARRWYGL
jgi:L-fuconolactonase